METRGLSMVLRVASKEGACILRLLMNSWYCGEVAGQSRCEAI
jgi:hypothetical protein